MEPSQIIQDLASSDLGQRLSAVETCAKHPELARTATIPLCRLVSDPDEQVAEWATAALEEMGPPASEELDALVSMFSSAEATAYWAVTLVGRLKPSDAATVALLAELIEASGTPDEVRNRAIWAIDQTGATTPDVRQALTQAAHSEQPRTARLAAKALAKFS
ncbi:HEAT repeat domain-containing protein [Blastopirellula marina]|uniref:HEAT repeat domain-containing protein n=1 Tax=Blastopirellula marina TaxID=124 RepID=A0A2S8FHV8_9BACT|nr:HEAT repeat domain-containing protein [Blastopirellula marina]PQO31733.1 hypothetical protein C5Y98_20185 [Blastopirellula marina]PTL43040.1 hypothetical protein C5Y97_20195 [Blastopirellula marina]